MAGYKKSRNIFSLSSSHMDRQKIIKKLDTIRLKQQQKPSTANKLKMEYTQTKLVLALQHYQHEHKDRR